METLSFVRRILVKSSDEEVSEDQSTMPSWANFLAVFLLCLGLYYLMRFLFYIAYFWQRKAEERMEEALKLRDRVVDKFREENGYSWDFVIVFKVTTYASNAKESDMKSEFSMRNIVLKLADAGLHTKIFYSSQHDEVYCKVRAPQARLIRQAVELKYKLYCDPINVSNLLTIGNQNGRAEERWGPTRIITDGVQTEIPPYEFIYADYRATHNKEDKQLYKKYGPKTIFQGSDRIKIIQAIITSPIENGGCDLNVYELQKAGCIEGFFPIHDIVELSKLEAKWFVFWSWPKNVPIDDVKNYFGEKIGFLTAFMSHYTQWLIWPAFLGFCTWLNVAAEKGNPNVILAPVYAFGMAIWATLFLESWKRRENRLGLEWGVFGDAVVETVRPEYVDNPYVYRVTSPVNGKRMLYFPRLEYIKRQFISTTASAMFIMCVIALFIAMFAAKFVMDADPETSGSAGIVASLFNAVIVIVMGAIYKIVVAMLNEYENHRTVTEYEDALIVKTFIVQFINTFTSLFFIAFGQDLLSEAHEGVRRCVGSCMRQIQETLSVLFLTKLATSSVTSLLVPYFNMKFRESIEFEGVKDEDISQLEREYLREEYELTLGPFTDYSEITLQFAYATMFISAYPLATCMALMSNYMEMRIKTWFFCHLGRRPVPYSVNDIGSWFDILEIISYIAVLTSAGLVAFTTDLAQNITWTGRIWMFVLFSGFIIGCKYLVQITYPRVDNEIDIQLKRNKYILDKLYNNIPDDDDTALLENIESMAKAKLEIRINDDDPC